MDPVAAVTVSIGTLGTCFIGAIGGASYALAKSQPPSLMGFAAGVNSGIAGLTFFALREYAISPALLLSLDTPEYAQRRAALGIPSPFPSSRILGDLSPADELRAIRQNRLLDTAISGAVTGAGLNYWRRGARGIIPGATTAALVCTLLQYAANELSVQRIRYVANTPAPDSVTSPPTRPAPLPSPPIAPSTSLIKSSPKPLSQKIVDTISYVIPLTRLDDKEYLQRLEQRRDALDGRIDRLQRELLSTSAKPS